MTMMNTSRSLAAALLVCALLLSSTVGSATAKKVALVYDVEYVDISESEDRSEWGEASNLRAFLESLNYSPYLVTQSDNEGSWTTALAQARTLIFAEGASTVPDDSVEPLRAWVRSGGVAVFCEDTNSVAQQLTELELSNVAVAVPIERGGGGGSWSKSAAGAASSLFANGPAQVGELDSTSTWYLDNDLPAEQASLKCMYGETASCAVWVYTQGSGKFIGVGPDFYDFGYDGGQDGGWVSVMTTIVGHGSSASQLASWVSWVAALY
ncbi:uncharacterized protein ACA1_139270 [Acanthamoeba castellanii str. Neff]|uniref:Uncharacterized protein n=1 Tax=Acanthamoeba castellanii (strain ATCC 30010 / Neff) TaxID=1257118 RepID=L8GMD1_ACACF|nr:uncharacterized protein ACA1_139270 [Acanthamoeba castellanii str. Neff]ELR14220.1 hypothetical protein ACA1_139270 [Acanthamoeba castellanii str. Neff]